MCWRDNVQTTRNCLLCGQNYFGDLGHRNCPARKKEPTMTESLMPLDVGAGYCRELEGPQGLRELVRTPVSSITVGSYTLESRPGNTGDVYSPSPRGTLNALNMPNRGFAWLLGELPEMIRITRAADKELTVSVAGFTPEENAFMVTEVLKRGVRVEVNWGCPNAGHDVISLDLGLVEKHLRAMSDKLLESHVGEKTSIMFKLSPHPSKSFRKALLHLIVKSHLGDGIVVCNTFPDGVGFSENGSPRINAVNPGGAKVMTGGVSG